MSNNIHDRVAGELTRYTTVAHHEKFVAILRREYGDLLEKNRKMHRRAQKVESEDSDAAWWRAEHRARDAEVLAIKTKLAKALKELDTICATSPPDDWDYYEGGEYTGYGKRGDARFVDEPDTSNGGDMFIFGCHVGAWFAAKEARKVLKEIGDD